MKQPFDPVKFLVVVTTGALFLSLLLLMFIPMPEDNADTIKGILQQIVIAWVGIVGYWFGSSSGSKAKTDLMHKNGDTPPGSVTTTAQVEVTKTTTTNPGGEPPKE